MANSVYQINKGINKSIEFRGLKAQYIWYLGGGLIGLLILFAVKIDQNYTDLVQFNTQNKLFSLHRAKDQQDVDMIRALYGIK